MISSPIYRRDSQGHIRCWSCEISGQRYRTHSGRHAGAIVTSGWVSCIAKSQPSDEEQAQFEAAALETRHLSRLYFRTLDGIDSPRPFMPMLAKVYTGAPSFPAISQPKLDGIRCIATSSGYLKRERIRRRVYRSRDEARQDVFDYIEMFSNPKRKHVRNGMLSPVEVEKQQKI
jgi:DNA ligase 1